MTLDDEYRFHQEWGLMPLEARQARVGWDGDAVVWLRGRVPLSDGEREMLRACLTPWVFPPLALRVGEWAWW